MISLDGIKHVSLDLWLTLIKSDARFKPARAKSFMSIFDLSVEEERVNSTFRYFDSLFNTINESIGGNLTFHEMIYIILDNLDVDVSRVVVDQIDMFYEKSEELFFHFPPQLLDASTAHVLEQVKDLGISVSLLSNTAFIKGATLRKLMLQLGLGETLDFQLYSDEVGHSKPSPLFFDKLVEEANKIRSIQRGEILHIGDNPLADVVGAEAAGMKAQLFASGTDLLSSIF